VVLFGNSFFAGHKYQLLKILIKMKILLQSTAVAVLFFFLLSCSWTNVYGADKFAEGIESGLSELFTGDFKEMMKRRVIRVLVPFNKTFYFLDGASQRGITYDLLKNFEKQINGHLKTKNLKLHILIIPTARDRLIPDLVRGRGDIAAGNLTITVDRLQHADFSEPLAQNISELVISAPSVSGIHSLEDLSGREIHVRRSSSYYQSLLRLNKRFEKEGREKVRINEISDYLEDEDLLEMVNADLLPLIIVDSHKAVFWKQIFTEISVHSDVAVRTGRKIGWAIRKNNPELMKVVNAFVKNNKKGTLFGNIIFKRYLKSMKYVNNPLQGKERERFEETIDLFRKYGDRYRFDWLMLMALAYQESKIDQSKRSHAGAIGVMQILPSTARDKNVNIPGIDKIDPNIHAGVKYLRFVVNRYFNEEGINELNRGLFAFASYNAGPAKVARIRREAAKKGFDPDVWFNSVEVVAARRIGRETVQYVSNIVKYYTAYRLLRDQKKRRQKTFGQLMIKENMN
jgi:membrane-bound lytic murein transglycosylase MltF